MKSLQVWKDMISPFGTIIKHFQFIVSKEIMAEVSLWGQAIAGHRARPQFKAKRLFPAVSGPSLSLPFITNPTAGYF